jgi:leucyl-tRNA synthetase
METHCKEYDFQQIEPKWQTFWARNNTFRAGADTARPKYYALDMFPYPSGAGLHLGHCENYAITDIIARFKRAQGYNVLYPIGWDAFGLPTENYAVKTGRHPVDITKENIATYTRQLLQIGLSYDFSRQINTTEPGYFRWTQWIWLQLFKRGLAYVEDKPVWWCPALGTVLANEEIVDGKSEVGGHPVERRPLRQWVLRITAYADRLLNGLKDLDWPDSTKRMQAAWIGRSVGSEVEFDIVDHAGERLKIFTTRVDTIHGATYMVIAPEHPLAEKLTTAAQAQEVAAYTRAAAAKSDLERTELAKDKSGVFTGSHAINPATGQPIPIWIADYVLASYGTGAIMAVPAHDERDYEFARKFDLPVTQVIAPADGAGVELPFCEKGGEVRLINSGSCTGLTPAEATLKLDEVFAQQARGKATVQFKLRDWLFSRQRYWGEPFPIVWVSETDYQSVVRDFNVAVPECPVTADFAGEVRYALPIPDVALPLQLPDVQRYEPTGTGESPLATMTDWLEIWYEPATGNSKPANQPQPAANWIRARRETNTMPQWAGSCWYYLRYVDPHNTHEPASSAAQNYWGTPDIYVGGAEHAVLHLLYARFWHKVLFDIGVVPTDEPFKKLFHQGIILGEDGEKMSKSRGNVANPDEVIKNYGADTLRLYLMFLGPLEAMKPWNPRGIEGVHRFLQKIWRECVDQEGQPNPKITATAVDEDDLLRLLHETIRKVGEDIANLRYNTAVSQMMIFANRLQKTTTVNRQSVLAFLKLLAPFAPHIAEELWSRLGESGSIGLAAWPSYDASRLVTNEIKLVFQVNGKHRGDQLLPKEISQNDAMEAAMKHDKVAAQLEGKTIRRVIFVPGKILNIVVG